MFWPLSFLRGIVNETNWYACASDCRGNLSKELNWKSHIVSKFKVFLAIILYISMKKQPNIRIYWQKFLLFFYCLVISKLMSRPQFEKVTKYFHNCNQVNYVIENDTLGC